MSRMTVSRVLNNGKYIKPETRERVLQAIEELKYRPNMVARTLVTRRNRLLAYVMVNISDPFHNMVSQGFESVAYRKKFTTMMCDTHSPSRERDYINLLLDHRAGGAVFHHLALREEQVAELQEGGVQCVLMDNEDDLEGVPTVNTDNRLGGALAAEYLASRGHRWIACIHGALERPEASDIPYEDTFQFNFWRQRTEGFTKALRRLGMEPAGYFESNGRFDYASERTGSILDEILSLAQRPTALYCENDIIAVTMLNELQHRKIRVPGEMAVMGHDGLDLCRMLHPYLTTVAQPRYEMGSEAARMLIDRIEKKTAPRKVVLAPALLVGETA